MKYFAEHALLPSGLQRNVTLDIAEGRFTAVAVNTERAGASTLPGVVLPGFANAHSHVFHRALRGRTHSGGGTFWTWREAMYSIARAVTPDSYASLARATYAEMALAGITSVGEFHYLHHAPNGERYTDPNVMADALRQAAREAGIRLTILDTCYLAGGLESEGHTALNPLQRSFSDGTADQWAERMSQQRPSEGVRIGCAIHSVRAVPRAELPVVIAASAQRALHVHLSEQPAENLACQAFYGATPTELLDDEGALGPLTTAVHATHLTEGDIATLGRTGTGVCLCPTTERDLADGIGHARRLRDAGSPLSLGSDQHAVIDLIEEARALEMHERLASQQRGRMAQSELMGALTNHASLGWPEITGLSDGAPADLVAVRTDSVRTAGGDPEQILMSATAADVDTVMVAGEVIVEGGQHRLGSVPALLDAAITPLWVSR